MKSKLFQSLCAAMIFASATPAVAQYNSCAPCEETCCDWYGYADWIYWRPCRTGLDYVVEGTTEPVLGKGSYKKVDPSWDSGFRIGFGAICDACDGKMNLGVKYTHLSTSDKDSTTDANNLTATRFHPATGTAGLGVISSSSSTYDLDLDMIDFEAGMQLDEMCDMHLRPFLAFRLAYLDQSMKTAYDIVGVKVKEANDMDAYGTMMGADVRWNVCGDFYFVSRFSGGVLWGDFDLSHSQKGRVDVKNCECRPIYTTEASAGLEMHLCDLCGIDLKFAAGYEFHTWHNMSDFINFTDDTAPAKIARNSASLMLDGAYVRLNAEF